MSAYGRWAQSPSPTLSFHVQRWERDFGGPWLTRRLVWRAGLGLGGEAAPERSLCCRGQHAHRTARLHTGSRHATVP